MARSPKFLEATFERVLLYADGPQIVLLDAPKSKIIAVAIHRDGMEDPFFGSQVSLEQFRDYLQDRFDLRYILSRPSFKRHYLFDLAGLDDGHVKLQRLKVGEVEERYLPDAGLFARDHTEDYATDFVVADTEETFGIDGSWDLPEFSRFYSQVADLYAFFNGVEIFSTNSTSDLTQSRVRSAFTKPFEGGGSYVSLFDSLVSLQSQADRLRVGGITYNSPGHVKIRGASTPLYEIRELIGNVQNASGAILESYGNLYKFLKKSRLLRFPAEKFDGKSASGPSIEILSRALADVLDVAPFDTLHEMVGKNLLITAKVLLSICRRAARLNEFFLEGRVNFDRPSSETGFEDEDLAIVEANRSIKLG